ncbi:MAG: hypothetical protein GY720_10380 [bacterium]|nr:hypothetical protein [bacterium]
MAIERADLESKLREIEDIVDETKEQARTTGTVLVVAAVVVAALLFFFGRRRGKKAGGARVEVYRLK